MVYPGYTVEEAVCRETFLALMWAMSYPGRRCELPAEAGDSFQAIGDTLLDLETSYYTEEETLEFGLAHTGARALGPDRASYHFFPMLTPAMLDRVEQASIGTMMYPDHGATFIIGCRFDAGTPLTLSGPGIPLGTTRSIQIDDIPLEFWSMRNRANRYPRGWDVVLVSNGEIISLPRSIRITLEE